MSQIQQLADTRIKFVHQYLTAKSQARAFVRLPGRERSIAIYVVRLYKPHRMAAAELEKIADQCMSTFRFD